MGYYNNYMDKNKFLETYKKGLDNGSLLKYNLNWLEKNIPKSISANGIVYNFIINWCYFSVSGGFYNFSVTYGNEESYLIATGKSLNLNDTLDCLFELLKNSLNDVKFEY